MLVIDNNKRNLLNMKLKMLDLSVGNFTDNLNAYHEMAQEIDSECYKAIIQKIKNSNYNNLPLEEQLKFFIELIDDYNDLSNQQIIFKNEYKKYTEDALELSNLDTIMIDSVEARKNQIEGYLINAKNLKSNKIEIDRLNQALITATKEKENALKTITAIHRKLKDDILNARGRIQNSNGSLEVTSIAIEFRKYDLDLNELIGNSELLDKVYVQAKRELDDIRETLDTALGLPNKDELICEKYMFDVLRSNYKFNLIELIKEIFNTDEDYYLFKDSLYKIDDLLKEIKNNLRELKVKFYINPFECIKIDEYIKCFEHFKNYDREIDDIRKTITYLTKMVEDMEKSNNTATLSINDDVTILKDDENTIYIDIEDSSRQVSQDDDATIYRLLKDDNVRENQVIKIANPINDFMFGIVKQKTSGVINRVYEMLNHKQTMVSTTPELIVEKKQPVDNIRTSVEENMPVFEEVIPFADSQLFEELPPFIEPQLFDERKDGDIFNDTNKKEMKINLSNDRVVNAFREQLASEDKSSLEEEVSSPKEENLFWIPKENSGVEPLVKKRAA